MQRIAGIYLITCRPPGQLPAYYVGQSVNVTHRIYCHRTSLKAGNHCNSRLQRAWTKHGGECFSFELLETCLPADLNSAEQWWLDMMVSSERCFNFAVCAESSRRGIPLSPREVEMLRERMRGDRNHMAGKRHTPEARAKITASRIGPKNHFFGKPKSAEWKAAAAERIAGDMNPTKRGVEHYRARSVISICPLTGTERVFETMTKAMNAGYFHNAIRQVCLGKRRSHGGLLWRYAD